MYIVSTFLVFLFILQQLQCVVHFELQPVEVGPLPDRVCLLDMMWPQLGLWLLCCCLRQSIISIHSSYSRFLQCVYLTIFYWTGKLVHTIAKMAKLIYAVSVLKVWHIRELCQCSESHTALPTISYFPVPVTLSFSFFSHQRLQQNSNHNALNANGALHK